MTPPREIEMWAIVAPNGRLILSSEMKDRPILFSAPMIRALLDGRKTQTRRIVKPSPVKVVPFIGRDNRPTGEYGLCLIFERVIEKHVRCPYGQPGDLLFVRETFSYTHGCGLADRSPIWYWADGNPDYGDWTRPKPSIHMPRWASRLTLSIVDVRVQRLQEISEEDAIAEGIKRSQRSTSSSAAVPCFWDYLRDEPNYSNARDSYSSLWESINGAGSWDANPWVWALTFEVIKANVDDVLKQLEAA